MLKEILAHKRGEIAALDACEWQRRAMDSAIPRGFLPPPADRLSRTAVSQPKLIAEIKRASPSRGALAEHLDPSAQALIYAENGAAAISILTDEHFFHGSVETLIRIRRLALMTGAGKPVPLLRKDFILTPAQVYQTRAIGADAMLLIAAALSDGELSDLHALALEQGLAPLVEVHDETELDRVLTVESLQWIGINNRNLATFQVDLQTSVRLCQRIPAQLFTVSESGFFTARDVRTAGKAGADAVLVGEALVTADNPAEKVQELAG